MTSTASDECELDECFRKLYSHVHADGDLSAAQLKGVCTYYRVEHAANSTKDVLKLKLVRNAPPHVADARRLLSKAAIGALWAVIATKSLVAPLKPPASGPSPTATTSSPLTRAATAPAASFHPPPPPPPTSAPATACNLAPTEDGKGAAATPLVDAAAARRLLRQYIDGAPDAAVLLCVDALSSLATHFGNLNVARVAPAPSVSAAPPGSISTPPTPELPSSTLPPGELAAAEGVNAAPVRAEGHVVAESAAAASL